ncbi:hypothetical protein [Planctobacterium marinum]|uniref:hypothetical protein n=1 Tax=Planctobacterium marinum TaxID=1631968 RepID=UPI001E3F3265|nr:hypothetical protein [Planctobacterium marinum]MCC2606632.1 hypothetical protein [Planctobacterium marinum]
MDYQVRMETAFDNYFRVSSILTDDLKELVKRDMTHDSAKRNFIRAACSLIEGYGHCFREILAIGLDMVSDLTKNQIKVIRNESGSSLSDRAKCTLTAMHKMFELEGVPDFGNNSWEDAKFALKKRDAIAHPKNEFDLSISEEDWIKIWEGLEWLLKQYMKVIEKLHNKY